MTEILDSLNPEQREAVTQRGGQLLIVAGPGTGKTKTLMARIAWLVRERSVDPSHVLAITFSNRAAKEMRERLEGMLLPSLAGRVNVGTFHATCGQILRRELGAEWSICSEEEQIVILRGLLSEVGVGASKVRRNSAEKVAAALSRLKGSLIDVASGQFPTEVDETELTPAVGRAYQAALEANKLFDFDDLILRTVRLFEKSAGSLAHYRRRFRHIAVDEFQDTNAAQFRLIEFLVNGVASSAANDLSPLHFSAEESGDSETSLTVIGDPDQAIYSFRGASSQQFIDFENSFPGARVVRLTRCYRSSPMILNAACEVIRRNPGRVSHRLESQATPGPNVQLRRAESEEDEAKFVVVEMRRILGGLDRQDFDSRAVDGHEPEEHFSFADFAVLYRLHAVGAALVEEFTRSGIPFQQIGGPLLREQVETRRLLAALRFLANREDRLSHERINSNSSREITTAVVDALRADCTAESPARAVLERLGERLDDDADLDGRSAWKRLIAHATAGDESLGAFLRRIDLERYEDLHDPRAEKVTLMTLHAAKGLEFNVVFLVGCETGVLPYLPGDPSPPASLPASGEKGAEIEEERRLLYVGMTRARRRLLLTWAASRFLFGKRTTNQASPFLGDIPASLVEHAWELTPYDSRRARRRGPRQRKLFLS